jgi:hypothetical protein
MNKKTKYEIEEEEFKSLTNDLKSLPPIKIPSDFDTKLRNKIALRNTKKENKFFSYLHYQKWPIYGFSICIVVCLVVFSIMLFNKQSSFNTIDKQTFMHDENKVTAITPLNTNDSTNLVGKGEIYTKKNISSSGKQVGNIGIDKKKNISSEKQEEYFTTHFDSNASTATDENNQTTNTFFYTNRGINLDSLKKIDSIKRKLDSQNVIIKKH